MKEDDLAYYQEQSIFTDPKSNTYVYAGLPKHVGGLASVVQDLLFQPYEEVFKWYSVNPDDVDCSRVFGIRKTVEFLERIHTKNSESLTNCTAACGANWGNVQELCRSSCVDAP